MSTLLLNNSAIVHAIGWTILHSLWQGLMLFCLLKIVLRFITYDRAKLRYNVSLAVLVAQSIWVINTFINQLQYASKQMEEAITIASINGNTTQLASISNKIENTDYLSTIMLWVDKYTNIIVILYILGIALLTVRLIYNLYALRNLKKDSQYSHNILWNSTLNKQAKRLGINRKIDLLLSKEISTPMVMGVIKPVILFPFATISNLSTEQFETILIHELAHIKRHDYLVNILQTILETILFYNPFIWLISKTIRIEREHSCDDIVTGNTDNKISYANALATLAVYAHNTPQTALAATGNKYQLLNRIKRIIEMKKSPITKMQITAVIVLVLSLVLSITLISPTLSAQTKEDKKEQKDKKKDDKKKATNTTQIRTISLASEKITITDDEGNTKTYSKLEDVPQEDREKLQNAFGKNTTVYFGPKKKVIVKTNGNYDVKVLNDEDIDIEIDALGEEFGKKISKQVLVALNDVDWEELGTGLQEAMKGLGEAMDGTGAALNEVGSALDEVKWDEIKEEINTALAEMSPEDRAKMKKELAKAKVEMKIAMAKAREDMKEAKTQMIIQKRIAEEKHDEAMVKHHIAMAKHKDAMKKHDEAMVKHNAQVAKHSEFEKMLKMMDKDGLIDRDNKFIIEKKGKKDLYIDGIKQSGQVYNKYKEYLSADELIIKGKKNSLSITVKDN